MIEQRRMSWPLSTFAEIIGSADQALAEMMLPDPVDHDAGGQRIVGARQPVGQLQPAAALGDPLGVFPRQNAWEPTRHGFTKSLGVAA